MDASKVQDPPAPKGNRTRSPEDLEGSYAKALVALGLNLREENDNPGDPDHVPGMAYAAATGSLKSIARDAIAVARFQRDLCEDMRRQCNELEDRIRELEGDDPIDHVGALGDLDNTRDH